MSKRMEQGSPELELRLSSSPDSSSSSSSSSSSPRTTIDDSSCLSSEPEDAEITSSTNKTKNNTSTTAVGTSLKQVDQSSEDGGMVLVGCPRCLMYVILSEVNPKCPICKSSVLLDLLSEVKNWSSK